MKKRTLHSPDPLDHPCVGIPVPAESDPSPDPWEADHVDDPVDQPNANCESEVPYPVSEPAPIDVRWVRGLMQLTQRQFAGWFGFPVATLRHWERGNRRPTGSALVLLHVIRENPELVRRAVRKARAKGIRLATIERARSYRAPPGFGERPPPRRPRGPRRR